MTDWLAVSFSSVIVIASLLLPGLALRAILLPNLKLSLPGGLAVALGLSLSFYPVLLLITSTAGLTLGPGEARAVMLISAIALLLPFFVGIRKQTAHASLWSIARLKFEPHHCLLLLVLVSSVAARLLPVRGLIVSPGADSYHHSLIAQMIYDLGKIPTSYEPYAPLTSFTYHFGFHSFVAFVAWLTGDEVTSLVIYLGQTINALVLVSVYALVRYVTGNNTSALVAALITGLLSVFPAYLFNWSRFTSLEGIVILPVALVLTIRCMDERRGVLASGIVSAGLFLTHYRIAVAYAVFVLLYTCVHAIGSRDRKLLRAHLTSLLLVGIVALGLASPWMWNLLAHIHLQTVGTSIGLDAEYYSLARLDTANAYPLNLGFFLLSICGLMLAIRKRQLSIVTSFLWVIILLLFSNPYWSRLPSLSIVDVVTLATFLFIPGALWTGYLVGAIHSRMKSTKLVTPIGVAVFCAAVLYGSLTLPSIFMLDSSYVGTQDMAAFKWIESNIPEKGVFGINGGAIPWVANVAVGYDAGYFLPLLAHRRTTLLPLGSTEETASGFSRSTAVNLAGLLRETPDSDETTQALASQGIEYVYSGSTQLNPFFDRLLSSGKYQLLFQNGRAAVFRVVGAQRRSAHDTSQGELTQVSKALIIAAQR